nr:MAG TPA: hypothetical protein [Caudoviricetes sp.]
MLVCLHSGHTTIHSSVQTVCILLGILKCGISLRGCIGRSSIDSFLLSSSNLASGNFGSIVGRQVNHTSQNIPLESLIASINAHHIGSSGVRLTSTLNKVLSGAESVGHIIDLALFSSGQGRERGKVHTTSGLISRGDLSSNLLFSILLSALDGIAGAGVSIGSNQLGLSSISGTLSLIGIGEVKCGDLGVNLVGNRSFSNQSSQSVNVTLYRSYTLSKLSQSLIRGNAFSFLIDIRLNGIIADFANLGGDLCIDITGSSKSLAHGQGQLARSWIIRSLRDGISRTSDLNRSSAGIQVDLDILRPIPLSKHIQILDVIQSGSAGVNIGLQSVQILKLLEISDTNTGRAIYIEVQAVFIGSNIKSTLSIRAGQVRQQTFLKRNSSHNFVYLLYMNLHRAPGKAFRQRLYRLLNSGHIAFCGNFMVWIIRQVLRRCFVLCIMVVDSFLIYIDAGANPISVHIFVSINLCNHAILSAVIHADKGFSAILMGVFSAAASRLIENKSLTAIIVCDLTDNKIAGIYKAACRNIDMRRPSIIQYQIDICIADLGSCVWLILFCNSFNASALHDKIFRNVDFGADIRAGTVNSFLQSISSGISFGGIVQLFNGVFYIVFTYIDTIAFDLDCVSFVL